MLAFNGDKYTQAIRAAIKGREALDTRRSELFIEIEAAELAVTQAERALNQHPDRPLIDQSKGIPSAEKIERALADHENKRATLDQAVSAARLRLELTETASDTSRQGVRDANEKITAARVAYATALKEHVLSTLDVDQFCQAFRRLGAAFQIAHGAFLDDYWYTDLLKLSPEDDDLAVACRVLEVEVSRDD